MISTWLRASLTILLLLFIVLMAVLIGAHSLQHLHPYSQPSIFLQGKEAHYYLYLPALYGHIFTSGIILILGALAFVKTIRKRRINWHRNLGKGYVFLVLFVSAPCAFVMALFAKGGWSVQLCFILLSSLWLFFTWKAWRMILQQNIQAHRAFMLRSYALTLSAVCLRWYTFFALYFWGVRDLETYRYLAWLSWVPNFLLMELYLLWDKKKHQKLETSDA